MHLPSGLRQLPNNKSRGRNGGSTEWSKFVILVRLIVSRNMSVRYAGALAQLMLVAAAALAIPQPAEGAERYVRYSQPGMFTYEELLALGEDKDFEPSLAKKLEAITTTPFVSNEAYYRGAKPHLPEIEGLGRSLRVLFWNIERGVTLDDVILLFTDKDGFLEKVQEEPPGRRNGGRGGTGREGEHDTAGGSAASR